MKTRNEREAHSAFFESTLHVGCSGDCEGTGDCTCSHALAPRPRSPRIPRLPEPRSPTLPFWTRLRLAWTRWRARW